jgi:hypothetical protein
VAIDARGRKLSKHAGARPLPDAPLAVLLSAWQFLDQPAPSERLSSVAEFWAWARTHWNASRLPPVSMLPAPAAYN